jgi:predicted DNA-binding transcriptional regulator AlpA
MDPMPDELMTPTEVADYLGLKIKTLHNWRSRRVGPPGMKVGGALRYRREGVDRWVAAQEAAEARTG